MKITETDTQNPTTVPERVTFNLTPRSSGAVYRSIERTGDNKTDIINRHIIEGSQLEDLLARGGKIFLQEPGEQKMIRLMIWA